jgi:glycosyltransferase involved in cell wall biosynthesis
LFLTFSFSSDRYSNVPVALYCDRTYEHHLQEERIIPTFADCGMFRMEKQNLQSARHVFCFNRACIEFIRDRYQIESPVLLKAGLNLSGNEVPEVNALIARKEACRNILFVGRGYRQRGIDILLNAFQIFNARRSDPFTLHLVGVSPNELAEPQAAVVCHGYLRKDDPAEYRKYIDLLGSARLFVFPMRFGPVAGALREALWMCTPVVLTNVPDASDRVQNRRNGVITERAEPEEIADCMSQLVNDQKLWRAMAAYAHESMRKETWDATVETFLGVVGHGGV